MTIVGALAIYLLPGSVLALHQGIDHWMGAHVPKLVILDREMPHWLLYSLVVLFGPAIMLLIVCQLFWRSP